MDFLQSAGDFFLQLIHVVYNLLWGDLITIPLPGGSSLGLSLLVLILIPMGIYCTIKTRFLPFRLFPEMIRTVTEKKKVIHEHHISGVQALVVSTATRVGMGNLVGVVAAISAGGAGAVFWMWVIALLGSSTAFVEATLAQLYKEKDPLYGGYRGGPAYYIHHLFMKKKEHPKKKRSVIAVLFALSGLLCWCGISQVVGNSVSSSFENAFASLHNHRSCRYRGCDRPSEECHSKSFRCCSSRDGSLLFCHYYLHHAEKYHAAAFGIETDFSGGFRFSSGCRRRNRRRYYERSKTWTFLQ